MTSKDHFSYLTKIYKYFAHYTILE